MSEEVVRIRGWVFGSEFWGQYKVWLDGGSMGLWSSAISAWWSFWGRCDDEVGFDGGVVGWGLLSGLESKIGGFYLRVRELVWDGGGNR